MIAAIQQAGLTKNILADRRNVKKSLENLDHPVQGLIKSYIHPFSPFDSGHPDAHEALTIDDFMMGKYDENDRIILVQ